MSSRQDTEIYQGASVEMESGMHTLPLWEKLMQIKLTIARPHLFI